MDAAYAAFETVKSFVFPLSALAFFLYPLGILLWNVVEGSAASVRTGADSLKKVSSNSKLTGINTAKDDGLSKPQKADSPAVRRRGLLAAVAAFGACAIAVSSAAHALGFVAGGSPAGAHGGLPAAGASCSDETPRPAEGAMPMPGTPATGVAAVACFAGLVAALKTQRYSSAAAAVREKLRARRGRVLRLAASSSQEQGASEASTAHVPRHTAPPPSGISLWHDVDLKVKSFLDEDAGLFHYVNEMPLGCLQKFEVQPHVPENAIEEDPKGSSRLAAFGKPVPFNYGCFPQTYRDPEQADELFNAPGDDDPLDVLDLGSATVGVGEVVRCRPLGAVCLIDEGQADWKILAVNVDNGGPLADAMSIEDVERIAPGRVQECLQWIDDFKQSSGKGEAKLHFQVHDQQRALSLLEADYASWQQLVAEAGADGTARGHWIRPAQDQKPAAKTVAMKMSWASPQTPPMLIGAARTATMARARSARTALTQSEPTSPPREWNNRSNSKDSSDWVRLRSP